MTSIEHSFVFVNSIFEPMFVLFFSLHIIIISTRQESIAIFSSKREIETMAIKQQTKHDPNGKENLQKPMAESFYKTKQIGRAHV